MSLWLKSYAAMGTYSNAINSYNLALNLIQTNAIDLAKDNLIIEIIGCYLYNNEPNNAKEELNKYFTDDSTIPDVSNGVLKG